MKRTNAGRASTQAFSRGKSLLQHGEGHSEKQTGIARRIVSGAEAHSPPACLSSNLCPLRFSARRTGVQGRSPAALFPRFLSRERNRAAGGIHPGCGEVPHQSSALRETAADSFPRGKPGCDSPLHPIIRSCVSYSLLRPFLSLHFSHPPSPGGKPNRVAGTRHKEQERPGSGAPAVYFSMGNMGGHAQTIQRYRYPTITAVRV